MLKNLSAVFVLGFSLVIIFSHVQAYEAMQGPSELIYWDKENASPGYTIFGSGYMIDLEGNFINKWPALGELLDNGNLMARGGGGREYDWDGNIVWQHDETRENYHPHHDLVRVFNPKLNAYTTMYIANKDLTHEQVIAAGAEPTWSRGGTYDGSQMDAVVEVDMNGNVVWEWWFFDHLVQDKFSDKENYVGRGKKISDYPKKLDINWGGRVQRDWLHINSMDYNTELDQVAVNSVHGEFYIIDHGATFIPGDPEGSIRLAASDKGDFIYRWGDPARYGQGDKPSFGRDWTSISTGHRQMGCCHDIQWIKSGLPGAGNLLVFDNGDRLYQSLQQSGAIEINPYLDANGNDTGKYVNPPDAGYHNSERTVKKQRSRKISNHVIWRYYPKMSSGFISDHGSGCRRMDNGNTLLCGSSEGHLLEVTPEGKRVWEYINPVSADGIKTVITEADYDKHGSFRAYRYGPDHPGLKGKDLTPKGTITELAAQGKIEPPRPRQRSGEKRGKKGGKK